MTNKALITVVANVAIQSVEVQPFDEIVALTLQTVAASSARVYGQTFALWYAWSVANKVNPLDLRPGVVLSFIGAENATTKTTGQRQLSALRKLAQLRYILNPSEDNRHSVEALKMVKAPAGGRFRAPGAAGVADEDGCRSRLCVLPNRQG
jgi:hypothetical protein